MKLLFTFSALALVLIAGCGDTEKPTEPAATDTSDPERPLADDSAAATIEDAPESTERPQTLEESGGEPDPAENEDKPIILAKAETPVPGRTWAFKDGKDFHRLVPTQPTLGGADKIEVAEIFWYGCSHCYEFEPYINRWAEAAPANTRFVRIPAAWNPLAKLHAQLYYTEEVLAKNGKLKQPEVFRAVVFAEYHQRGNRLTSLTAIRELFTRVGISEEDFESTWGSFEIAQKLRVAQDLSRRYAISGVPAMVVNGKYRSGKTETGSYPKLLDVVDELIARESVR